MAKPEQTNRLADVFGVSRELPLTYTERKSVDGKFLNSLARDKHLVVYGGSKQGKTCLRKHCLRLEDSIVVQCGNSTTIAQLYAAVLKEAGASVDVSEKTTTSGEHKLRVEIAASGRVPFVAKGEAKVAGEATSGNEKVREKQYLEIDPSDPNDVIRVLQSMGFSKFIVLEDFHYLSEEVQKQVAMDLKAFHEKSGLCFIVVGVWLESNRLVLYNGDLGGRLIPIDADRWEEEELKSVIRAGESLLNIDFPRPVRDEILSAAQGNVGILQEACYRLCEEQEVFQTQDALTNVGTVERVQSTVNEIATEQAGRYQNFLTQFSEGFQKTELEMYRWIAYVLIHASTADLKTGLKAFDIFNRMRKSHPKQDRLLFNNVLQALKNVAKLQHSNKVQPVILDFDSNENTLRIVDGGFTLFLGSQDRKQLVSLIGL
jgi:hypothetical protein